MPNMPSDKRQKIYCNTCKRETNHFSVGEHLTEDEDEESGWFDRTRYNLWVCAGCETGTLESVYQDISMGDELYVTHYPKRSLRDLSAKRFVKLKPKLRNIYQETVKAFNDGSVVLCTAGLRALLEGVCGDKRARGKNLRARIDNLYPKVLPNKNIIRNLHHFRFTGNDAIHELEAPSEGDVRLAIEVMEDLLNFLYELDYKASKLKASAKESRAHKMRVAKLVRQAEPAVPIQNTDVPPAEKA